MSHAGRFVDADDVELDAGVCGLVAFIDKPLDGFTPVFARLFCGDANVARRLLVGFDDDERDSALFGEADASKLVVFAHVKGCRVCVSHDFVNESAGNTAHYGFLFLFVWTFTV